MINSRLTIPVVASLAPLCFLVAVAAVVLYLIILSCYCCLTRKPVEETNEPVAGEPVEAGNTFAYDYGNTDAGREPYPPHDYNDAHQQPRRHRRGRWHEWPVTAIVARRGPHVGTVVPDGPTYSTPYGCEAVQYGEAIYVAHPDGDGAATSNHARQLKPERQP
ncbi:hypothetical protein NESM_000896400 [Novymonas esmeraldas]|uniref:Uncharacterized protein n=1 Tax=Novymonas esmeraldas TaxID=1808958 RepID=A0AAW0F1I5_9TRYP